MDAYAYATTKNSMFLAVASVITLTRVGVVKICSTM